MKSKLLLITSIALTLYLIISTLVYILSADDFVARAPVLGAIYLLFVIIHEGLVLLAVLLQWCGYFLMKKGFVIFATLLLLVAAVELGLLLYPLLFLIPLAILNLFVRKPVAPPTVQ